MNIGLLAGAFGLGASLGILPGPVQFLLVSESSRGGVRRGFAAMAGANGAFGVLLVGFAAGAALLAPAGTSLRILRVAGGLFLLFLAIDAMLSFMRSGESDGQASAGRGPLIRGIFAVILNPGAWIFLATTASSLFANAAHTGGRAFALVAAVVMLCGVASVDGPMVLLGSGVRRLEQRAARWLTPVLALGLGGFGALLLAQGLRG